MVEEMNFKDSGSSIFFGKKQNKSCDLTKTQLKSQTNLYKYIILTHSY